MCRDLYQLTYSLIFTQCSLCLSLCPYSSRHIINYAESLLQIITSGVSQHKHQAVVLQYFETVVRYEKFFTLQPDCIMEVMVGNSVGWGVTHSSSQNSLGKLVHCI